jgi:hypothetical protein
MNRPVDPWATAHDPTQPEASALGPGSTAPYPTVPVAGVGEAARGGAGPMYGRASVPVAKPQAEASEEMALVAQSPRRSVPPPKKVSWQRTSSASRRSLSDGWGFTATGLIVAFCGWGIWAAAAPSSVRTPIVGLVIMLLVAAGLFALTRFLGLIVIERMWGRRRLHARWAHLFTGLFLTFAGVAYFVETTWIVDGIDWLQEQWQRI